MRDSGNDRGKGAATLRVLVADQDPEMLEAVARAFEVDLATSKATCIDLLRANDFDVLVACERLTDGSGLELLSHVGQRWPNVLRILAIEPQRRALLGGRLAPFKLFGTIPYPIEETRLEGVLTQAAQALAQSRAAAGRVSASAPSQRPAPQRPSQATATLPGAQRALSRPNQPSASTNNARMTPAALSKAPAHTTHPPMPTKVTKVVPLGSPVADPYRILPRDYRDKPLPGSLRGRRGSSQKAPRSLPEKAAALAAEALAALARYIRPRRQMHAPANPAPAAAKRPRPNTRLSG